MEEESAELKKGARTKVGMAIHVFSLPGRLNSLQLSKCVFIMCSARITHCATCWEPRGAYGKGCTTSRSLV